MTALSIPTVASEEGVALEQKMTMYTLAEQLGVTVTAVSRAFTPGSRIKEEKRLWILKKAQELGYVPNESASRLSRPRLRLGAVMNNGFEPYYRELKSGFDRAAQELSGYKVDCVLRVLTGAENTPETTAAVLDELRESGVDGVAYTGTAAAPVQAALRRLQEAGVRLALIGGDIPALPRLLLSANDTETAGYMAAQMMSFLLPGAGRRVAVLAAALTSENQQSLVGSFCRHGLACGLTVLPPIDTLYYPGGTAAAVAGLFEQGLCPEGLYVSTANCLPVCELVAQHPGVRLITSDLFEEMLPYFESGVICASIYQAPELQAHDAMCRLYDSLARHEAVPPRLLIQPQLILKSNLSWFCHKDRESAK